MIERPGSAGGGLTSTAARADAPGVADLIREFDWSTTPLGAAHAWPAGLRSVVDLMLGSRYAMWLAWGPDLTFMCNDAYRPTLGAKPRFIGVSARDVWAEIWADIGPRIEHVLLTGEATWDESLMLFLERSGFTEESYHTFSYSPVRGAEGKVDGMLCVVTEDTARVLSERRLATLARVAVATPRAQPVRETCRRLIDALADSRGDLPFVALYLFADADRSARLVSSTHPDERGLARRVELDRAAADPLAALLAHAAQADEPFETQRVADLFPCDLPWQEPVRRAVVAPLARHGVDDRPTGCLIAAISPRLRMDREYQRFLELLAAQCSSALADALAFERERKRSEELAALDRAKTAFFSNVSHELRTPLTLMLSPLEDLAATERDTQRLELLGFAQRNGHRLLRLVNSLLEFARIEAGRVDASFEPVDLAALTIDVASTFRSTIERGGLAFEVDCALDEPVFVDTQMWERIVLNLLSNAFKFTLAGNIAVRLARADQQVVLSVEDTGSGIAQHELPRLFERFRRIEGASGRSMEGSGIGLALVHELVKLHGGTIEVASELGRGSRFAVRVPLGSAHLSAAQLHAAAPHRPRVAAAAFAQEALGWLGAQGAAPRMDGKAVRPDVLHDDQRFAATFGARILIVDDNADMRAYLASLLVGAYDIEVASDGLAALEAARRVRPDLIVSDVMMPRLDGFGLLEAVRDDLALRDVPLILLSARAGEESRIEGLDAGADDYLIKPFSARELAARVGALLERRQIRSAHEKQLELALSSIQDQFCMLDAQLAFTLVNRRFVETTGLSMKDTLGHSVFDLFPELRATRIADELYIALRHRSTRHFEFFFARFERWMETRIYPAEDGLLVLLTDVTGRKRDQEALRLRTAQFETLLNEAPYGVYLVDHHLSVREVNPAARPAFGALATDLIGADLATVMREVWPRPYADEIVAVFRHTLKTGEPHHAKERCEPRRDRTATECYEWEVHRIVLPGGQYGVVCYFHDVTAQVRVRQKLEAADRQKDDFLATLSHELRNPLAPIRSAAAVLDSALTPEQLAWAAQVIQRQVGHMSLLLDDLLDLARITRGKLELKRDVVSLGTVVNTAVEASRPLLDRKHHALTIALPNPDVLVDADACRLAQVISNLLNNAGKYTDPGGRIELTSTVDGEWVDLRVRDNGIGLPPHADEVLFGMFTQVDAHSQRAEGGLGVGLALARGLVELHGGTIEAASEGAGKGSEFRLNLPIALRLAGTAADDGVAQTSERAVRRVLVVDDNRDAADSLVLLLALSGHDVRVANSGGEALDLAGQFEPEVVLLDIGLPDLSGFDVARRLRERSPTAQALIVALTGWGQDDDRRKAVEAGFDWHVTKPADPALITELVTRSRDEVQRARDGSPLDR